MWALDQAGLDDGSDLAIGVARLRAGIAAAQGSDTPPDRALLASESHMADALAAGPLQHGASLYLTQSGELEASVLKEFTALGIREVWLLGGPDALAPAVETALQDAGIRTRRIAGRDRIETAAAIADVVAETVPTATTQRYVARAFGESGHEDRAWADALALGALAASTQTPVLLTDTDALSPATQEALAGVSDVTVIGGHQAVSAAVAAQIDALTVGKSTRVGGASRSLTAAAVRTQFARPDRVIVIDGQAAHAWQLGFVVAGLSADMHAPVVLTNGAEVPAETQRILKQVANHEVVCIGSAETCAAVTAHTK